MPIEVDSRHRLDVLAWDFVLAPQEHPLAEVALLLRPHRAALALTALAALVVAITSLGLARAAAGLLEAALVGAFTMPLLLVGLAALRVTLGIIQQRASTTLGHRVATELRASLMHHVLRAELVSLPPSSELLTRIAHDVTQVQSLAAFRAPTLLSDAATASVLLAYALWLAPIPCMVAALPALLALPFLVHHGRQQARAEDAARAAYAAVYEHVADTLEAALVIRHQSSEAFAESLLRKTLDAFEVAALRARHRATRVTPIPHLAALAAFILVAHRVAHEVAANTLDRQAALTLVIVLTLAARPSMRLATLTSELGPSLASARRVAALLRLPSMPPKPRGSTSSAEHVQIDKLTVERASQMLLADTALGLRRGEMVAVTGENGTGKSSLLLALADLLPHRKRVTADGASSDLDVAWVPQTPALILGDLRSNVALRPDADDAQCLSALARVGMEDADLNLRVEAGGRNLSLGERHKIALARALYLDRPILLLDEPTASLDHASTQTFLATLKSLRTAHAIVVVSHDDEVIASCDRVVRIDAKALIEVRSTPTEPST